MAAHLRTQIRQAAVADLQGLPLTGAQVYSGRAYNLAEKRLPALLVYTRDEDTEIATSGAPAVRTQQRELALVIEARAKAVETAIDDLLDQIDLEVEQALMAAAGDPGSALYPLILALDLTQTERRVEVEGQQPIGGDVIVFTATYSSREADASQRG